MVYTCPRCETVYDFGEGEGGSSLRRWCPACTAKALLEIRDHEERLAARNREIKAKNEKWLAEQIAAGSSIPRSERKVGAGGWRQEGDEILLAPTKSEVRPR